MKTFKDLEFTEHPGGMGSKEAEINFANGYGVSVITGSMWYSTGKGSYELAVLHNGSVTYDTNITYDVLGYISEDEVTEIMKQVQEL